VEVSDLNIKTLKEVRTGELYHGRPNT